LAKAEAEAGGLDCFRCFRPATAAARVRRSVEDFAEDLLEDENEFDGEGLCLLFASGLFRISGEESEFGTKEWFLEFVSVAR